MKTNSTKSASKAGCKYVYAIAEDAEDRRYVGIGLGEATVYPLRHGPLALFVSDIKQRSIRPERRMLAAHHQVIKTLMQDMAILPVAFGTIAKNETEACAILKERRDDLIAQLDRVRGKVEMGLSVKWDVPNIFEYFVAKHSELAIMRDSLVKSMRVVSRDDKIEVGRLFDRLLNGERELHTRTVCRVLKPYCVEILESPVREEREVMRLACLVERDKKDAFANGVLEAARLFDDYFSFDFNGPWAPYNFINVVIKDFAVREHRGVPAGHALESR